MEKSNIDLLKEFAKSTSRSIDAKEYLYPRTGISTTQKFKRSVYIPNNSDRSSFFIWFKDPYSHSSIGQTVIFSGVFIPLRSNINGSLNIRNKYFIDKLNPFAGTKENSTGNSNFHSKVVISGDMDNLSKRILSSTKVQTQILNALKIESYFRVAINHFNIDFVPELKGKSTISIISQQGWEMNKATIEKMFACMEKLRTYID